MTLYDTINDEIKRAMLAKIVRLDTLRAIKRSCWKQKPLRSSQELTEETITTSCKGW